MVAHNRSRSKITGALRQLMNRPGHPSETVAYIEQTVTGFMGIGVGAGRGRDDRGAAILLSTNVENAMRIAIERALHLDPKYRSSLFEDEHAPFQTFSAKATMVYALGLIGESTKKDMALLNLMRNVFSHAAILITFSTPEIIEGCSLLNIPSSVRGDDPDHIINSTGRDRFRYFCGRVSSALRYVRPDQQD